MHKCVCVAVGVLNTISLCKVDYQEKQFAQGVIPNTYMRREGAPKERELLVGRIIDRPIRPLFPTGFYHEVQVWFDCFYHLDFLEIFRLFFDVS